LALPRGTVGRRRFDHLFIELSLAVDALVPRYALWLEIQEFGFDPNALTGEQATAFCDGPLRRFLFERGFWLSPRSQRRLRRLVERHDPGIRTPEEHFARL
jgi:hypothetical protein